MSKMGISVISSYRGGINFEAVGLSRAMCAEYLPRHAVPHLRDRRERHPGEGGGHPRTGLHGAARHPAHRRLLQGAGARGRPMPGRRRRCTCCRWRATRRASRCGSSIPSGWRRRSAIHLRDLMDFKPLARPVPIEEVESITSIRKRFVTPGMSLGALWTRGAPDAVDRHEPDRREVRFRRGRRGSEGISRPDAQWRQPLGQDQAGGAGPVRGDGGIPAPLRGAGDQDRAGRQARRGRPAAGDEGDEADRQAAPLDAGGDADLAAAASRHLLDRGPGAAHLRPEADQPEGQGDGEARGLLRSRHDRGGRGQGQGGHDPDLGA